MSDKKPTRPRPRTPDDACTATPGRNADESPLAWLASRKDKDGKPMISDVEFSAGERLRADFHFAQMTPRVTVNWSQLLGAGGGKPGSPDHGAEVSAKVLAAQERVRRALKSAGPDMAGILIDVCCHLQGLESVERHNSWPHRSGKHFLRIALRQLARHYGMLSDSDPRLMAARKISHWGAEGFRPTVGKGDE